MTTKAKAAYAVCITNAEAYASRVVMGGEYNDAATLRAARFARDHDARVHIFAADSVSEAIAQALGKTAPLAVVEPATTREPARWLAGEDGGEVQASAAKKPAEAARLTNRAAIKAALRGAGLLPERPVSAARQAVAEAEAKINRAREAMRAALLAAGMEAAAVEAQLAAAFA